MAYSVKRTGNLPILGVAAGEDNFNDNLILAGLGDVRVYDVDLGASGDESFLHGVCCVADINRSMVEGCSRIEE